MKIAVMSDSHDNWKILEKAVDMASQENCEYILFAGDFISPNGLSIFQKFKGKVEMVWGNNEGNKQGFFRDLSGIDNITMHGEFFEGEVGGVKVFMNHYVRLAEISANSGDFDLCIGGHFHKYSSKKINDTILLCAGNLNDWSKKEEPSFIVFETKDKSLRQIFVD